MRICGIADDGTEASGCGDTLHVYQGSDEELRRRPGVLTDKDAAGSVVNEDRRFSRTKVRIEVGNNPAQMDGEGAEGLLVGEAVRLPCCRERGQLPLRGQIRRSTPSTTD